MKIDKLKKLLIKLDRVTFLSNRYDKTNTEISFEEFGAVGDGVSDDTESIKTALEYAKENNLSISSRKRKTYLISSTISIDFGIKINLNGSKIITNTIINSIIDINSDNVYIENSYIDCNSKALLGIHLSGGNRIKILNSCIESIFNIGLQVEAGNVEIYNCTFIGSSDMGVGIELKTDDNYIYGSVLSNCNTGIKNKGTNFINNSKGYIYSDSISLNSIFVNSNGGNIYVNGSRIIGYSTSAKISQESNVYINNMDYLTSIKGNIFSYSSSLMSKNIYVTNSYFINSNESVVVNLHNLNNTDFLGKIYDGNYFENINKVFTKNEGICSLSEDVESKIVNFVLKSRDITEINLDLSFSSSMLSESDYSKFGSVPGMFIPYKDIIFNYDNISVLITTYGDIKLKGSCSNNTCNILIHENYIAR